MIQAPIIIEVRGYLIRKAELIQRMLDEEEG